MNDKSMMFYVASPYTHPENGVRIDRFHSVCAFTARLMRAGHMAFSPIAHSHPIAIEGELPTDIEFWREFCRRTLSMCDAVIVLKLEGWQHSAGVSYEIALARELGKKVFYLDSSADIPNLGIEFEVEHLRAKLAAWEPVVRAAVKWGNSPWASPNHSMTELASKLLDLPEEFVPEAKP